MHKAFPLPGIEFSLAEEVSTASEEGCYCQKKREATTRKIALLSKSRRNCQSKSNDSFTKFLNLSYFEITQCDNNIRRSLINSFQQVEVIEFGDSYEVPASTASATITDITSGEIGKKSGRTVTLIAEDMQKKKNDIKARTTLLLSLPDEHQLRFSKYKTAQELWGSILKTFGGNEATKKTKKNLLKQQYGNFKAEGSETLEQTFNRLNKSDLDTMSLDNLYNHLKVYESEVHKKSEPNSQNIAFISLAKHSSGNEDGNTACVPTVSTNVPTASASVATISQDTACAYIAS
nr:ribonuclease H-like domain-containing protein [Tanacetum cinerariifolium]GFA42685.1 ribonuclease H-like domain-containing protein [Tanacetum cinerariifolium]